MSGKFTVVTRDKQIRKPVDNSRDYEEEIARQNRIMKAVEKLTAQVTRTFADKMIETIRKDHKYCVLFTYNDDPEAGEVFNDTIDDIPTKFLLSGDWVTQAKKFFVPIKCRTIGTRINAYITDKKFHNGVDPVTKQKYNASIFHYKSRDSVFKNGIIISRDGIIYK